MPGAGGPEVSAERPDRVPPREAPGGRAPAEPPAAPYAPVVLDRFQLSAPVTLEDMAEIQRATREIAGGSVEVYSHTGHVVVVDVRWPNGSRVYRELAVR